MKILKVSLKLSDSLKKILECLKKTDKTKIVFDCPRGFLLFSDISVLKKIKDCAFQYSRVCEFVTTQSFLRKILAFQGFRVHETFPYEEEPVETVSLDAFLDPVSPEKNPKKTTSKTNPKKQNRSQDSDSENKSSEKPTSKFSFTLRTIDPEENKKPLRGKFFFGFLALIAFLVGILFWISPKAVITLKPEVSVLPITQNFLVQLPTDPPPEEVLLPMVNGIYVENEVNEKQTFQTTGRKYDLTNAYGSVTLYNETQKPKYLVPSRLSTHDGTIFRFSEPVTIPPKQGDLAGEIIVNVVADEYDSEGDPIGHRGNIVAGTELFFPALREELQELYYAKANRGPLVGGSTLTHYFMAEDDIAKTKEFLEQSFRQRALEKLREEIKKRSIREGKSYILIDHPQLLKSEIVEEEFPKELVGEPIETFEVYVNLLLKGIVFDQTEVVQILEEKVQETLDARKKLLYIDEVSGDYSVLAHPRPPLPEGAAKDTDPIPPQYINDQNQVKVSVQMKGIEMFDFYATSLDSEEWRQSLKKTIAGKSKQEALALLTNFPEIENITDIYIAPFWSHTIPRLFDKIEFVVTEE